MDQSQLERISTLFKAFADPVRLQILGLLAERPLAGHELANHLRLTPPTISHHMRRLIDAGLVDAEADAQARIYSLKTETLRHLARVPEKTDAQSHEKTESNRIVRTFFDGPRLRQMPASRKKRVIVLRHLLERFAPDRDYPEKEVNALLQLAHEDVATLRRELVDYGFMNRDRGIYRVATELPERGSTVMQEVGNEAHWFAQFVAQATARAISDEPIVSRKTPPSRRARTP